MSSRSGEETARRRFSSPSRRRTEGRVGSVAGAEPAQFVILLVISVTVVSSEGEKEGD